MNFHPIENSSDTAEVIVPILIDWYKPKSVLDLGCNTGVWLRKFMNELTEADVMGIDGHNMIPELKIPRHRFVAVDLTKPIDLCKKFDLVLCLEVAEHLEEQYADTLVDTAVRHSDTIFWSSATVGQTGWHHVNERPLEYWIEKFKARGYEARLLKDELPQVPHDYYRKNAIEFKKMKSYSQNSEDLKILNYFEGFKGTLLSLGENQGTFLSNARLLIENGWKATLVEPSPEPFMKLSELYANQQEICLVRSAIGVENGTAKFYDSGTHLNQGDTSLLSTLKTEETDKWKDSTEFKEIEVPVMTFDKLIETSKYKRFNFISIDCEGFDLQILQQMDLTALGCSCLIIEWNGVIDLKKAYIEYCGKFGLKLMHSNQENCIFTLP